MESVRPIFTSTSKQLVPPTCSVCNKATAAFEVSGNEGCGECGNSVSLCIDCGHQMLKESYEMVGEAVERRDEESLDTAVVPLGNNNKLENIQHMLRKLANDLESGAEAMPATLLCVAIHGAHAVPTLFVFGDDSGVLIHTGALHACAQQMATAVLEVE